MPVVNSHLRQGGVKSLHFYNSTIFLSLTRSIHSTLTYHTHHVYVKYVKTLFLFEKGLNIRKKISREKFPTNPHGLVEKFSCNSDEGRCMLGKCSL